MVKLQNHVHKLSLAIVIDECHFLSCSIAGVLLATAFGGPALILCKWYGNDPVSCSCHTNVDNDM